ncbi:fibrinogen-like YCDxxxxGGGW domain-containing protein [Chryseobacterium sp. CT-SW4]|uniref:fibrinogen-like YCDxxxxGGGW domain-containing protein n=1 Tax=Chryseobacterium sp. SW-1 TaxID=3157343 RepID=UPI003B028CC6
MKINLTLLTTALFSSIAFGQVGINNTIPKATLDIKKGASANFPEGILVPSFTVSELETKDADYGDDQNGVMVFIASGTGNTGKTANILGAGFYYYDSATQLWVATGSKQPWYSQATGQGATSNSENIYQVGQIGVGSSTINTSAQLDIASSNKGVLIPRLSANERENITSPANGLMIFNTSTNCLNYYDGTVGKWLSLCGTYDPAKFNIINCDAPTGPSGTYTQGTTLGTGNTYTLSLNITEIGTYQIMGTTTNGYSFSKTGVFTQTGNQNIVLEAQGTPANGPQTDAISFTFNGISVTPNCSLPGISVAGATTSFQVDCTGAVLNGAYSTNIALDGTHYIDIPITSVTTPGSAVIETPIINGIKFSSGSVNITAATTSIRLYGQGTPTAPGTNLYSFTPPGTSSACSVSVNVVTSTGTFASPANRCTDILSEDAASKDGYYWIKDAAGNKFKTYCDMTNGGWTLVKSLSERQIIVVERTQSESIGSQGSRNPVTTEAGVFNEYAFSVPAAVVNNVGSGIGNRNVRFTIKEKGHTTAAGATVSQVESSTVAPVTDTWALNNYWNVTITDGGNPATGNYTSDGYNSEGKLFGFSWGKPSSSSTQYVFNGTNFAANPPGFWSEAGFFTGFYSGLGYVSNNNAVNNLTYTSSNGAQVTFNKYYINDLFGLYLNNEMQLNHHIGTCANSSDDYAGESYCNAGWSNWRAHNFNQRPDGSYEGRIIQYWVK